MTTLEWCSGWPPRAPQEPDAFHALSRALRAIERDCERLACGSASRAPRALWTDAISLRDALIEVGADDDALADLSPHPGESILVVSAAPADALSALGTALLGDPPLAPWPVWLAAEGDPAALIEVLAGRAEFPRAGSLLLRVGSQDLELALYCAPGKTRQAFTLASFPEKIGESPDQLRSREEWFTKRHGGRKR